MLPVSSWQSWALYWGNHSHRGAALLWYKGSSILHWLEDLNWILCVGDICLVTETSFSFPHLNTTLPYLVGTDGAAVEQGNNASNPRQESGRSSGRLWSSSTLFKLLAICTRQTHVHYSGLEWHQLAIIFGEMHSYCNVGHCRSWRSVYRWWSSIAIKVSHASTPACASIPKNSAKNFQLQKIFNFVSWSSMAAAPAPAQWSSGCYQ